HEAEVGLDETLLGAQPRLDQLLQLLAGDALGHPSLREQLFGVQAPLDRLGQIDLLLRVEQGGTADPVKIRSDEVLVGSVDRVALGTGYSHPDPSPVRSP